MTLTSLSFLSFWRPKVSTRNALWWTGFSALDALNILLWYTVCGQFTRTQTCFQAGHVYWATRESCGWGYGILIKGCKCRVPVVGCRPIVPSMLKDSCNEMACPVKFTGMSQHGPCSSGERKSLRKSPVPRTRIAVNESPKETLWEEPNAATSA
jgi:hypothetical protein